MTTFLQVAEWGRVDLPAPLATPAMMARLVRASQTVAGDGLVLRRSGLFARGIAGAFRAGDVQVQIVPKVYASSTADTDATTLLELMLATLAPTTHAVVPASLGPGPQDISEHILGHLALRMDEVLRRRGPPRRYSAVEEESPVLRGRIDLRRAVRRTPAESNRLPIRHHPLDVNNPLARVLAGLAAELGRVTTVRRTAALFRECSRMLPVEGGPSPSGRAAPPVVLSRLEEEWRPFVEIAEIVASGRYPSPTRAGHWDGFALLAPLDSMFERVLGRALGRVAAGVALTMTVKRLPLLRRHADGAEVVLTRPDYVLSDANGPVVVGDAKWKRLQDRAMGASPGAADTYQVATYLRRYGTRRGVLFYPTAVPISDTWRRTRWDVLDGGDSTIDVVELDVQRLIMAATRHEARAAGPLRDLRALVAELSAAG